MNYQIEHGRGIPAYIQLYMFMRDDIVNGAYACGMKLPSKRTIAVETGVSVITVGRAMELLCEEGYVEAKERSGYYVIYKRTDFPGWQAGRAQGTSSTAAERQAKEQAANAAGESQNKQSFEETGKSSVEKPAFPFSVMARTMRKVLQDEAENILVRCPGFGLEKLRKEICAYLARNSGMKVNKEQVIIGAGAEYLYGLIAQLFGKEKIFALENPSYVKIRAVYEALGKSCEMLDLGEDGIKSDALRKCRAKILHVTPFHSYPSGVSASISKKHEYLAWAYRRGGYVIEDNYDSELTVSRKAEDPLFDMDSEGRVIYINTFSHTISASLRIGYMVLPVHMADAFKKQLGFYSCTVPVFEQYVLAELLSGGEYERHINRERRRRRNE